MALFSGCRFLVARQHGIMAAFFKNFVFDDPNWDWKMFDFDKDVALPGLSAFRRHGGKLLQYHGWNDPAISPLNSIDYFESVQKKMGDTGNFYRLFMVPGMEHCVGGPGPSDFGKMPVIVDWVENGKAPDRIVAKRPDRTRPLCPYPRVAKYKGSRQYRQRAELRVRGAVSAVDIQANGPARTKRLNPAHL